MMSAREKAIKNLEVKHYLTKGRIPWSQGYLLYREQFIAETLANPDLMHKFQSKKLLPPEYGFALDERCVEYPWLFAQLDKKPARVLDAGSALNHKFLLDQPVWKNKNLHILTLSPEENCYWENSISYLFEDIRDIPISESFYDLVISISTLEHIGFNNKQFTGADSQEKNGMHDFIGAIGEMRRVLKSSGHLLFTVPFGRYRNLGTQQVFDENLLQQAIAAFGPGEVEETFFVYSKQGWQFADISECKEREYVDWIMLPSNLHPTEFPVQPDGAATARAVACIKLRKQ